jgi:xanthine permease XanP
VGDKKRAVDGFRGTVRGAWAGLVRNEAIGRLRSVVRVQVSPIPGSTIKKPANIIFGVEEEPPSSVIWISAVQHVGVIAIFMIYPLIIGRAAGASTDLLSSMLRMGMLALAIAVLLQALPRGPVGSRLLAPSIFTGVYLAPSLMAAQLGGLPLVWGMTIFAGLTEIALAQLWSRLRAFIPSETAGLVVLLIGMIIGLAALRVLLGNDPSGSISGTNAQVAGMTLAVMIGLNIWNKGRLRLFCILIGMVVGYVLAGAAGLLTAKDAITVLRQPLLALPSVGHLTWTFDAALIIPFMVTGLAAAMSTTAVVTTYQKITDADWVRPEPNSIKGGIFGDGIANTAAGLLGTYGMTVSTANVGLVAATGVASRQIGFVVSGILALLALQPTLVGVLTIMPLPVMTAAMLFTSVFIIISGVQIITSRVLDARRTLVIGMGMLAFLVVSVFPAAFAGVPPWAQPLTGSPLVLATLVALFLNLIFRIGIRRKVATDVNPGQVDYDELRNFIERNCATWGARRDVATRAEFAVLQAVEAIVAFAAVETPISCEISYDEFDIDVVLAYQGKPLELSDLKPTTDEIVESEQGAARLAGFLIRHQSDEAQAFIEEGSAKLLLRFRQ